MHDSIVPKLAKWPFLLGGALLLGAAFYLKSRAGGPLDRWQMGLLLLSVAVGIVLAILPFLLEYRTRVKLAETDVLADAVAKIQKVEALAAQISAATGQWEQVQQAADKTAAGAKGLAERMAAEVKAFSEFMDRMNESEKATLRVEVEKLRRAEGEWLQILVRMLDHIYALHQGALRSHQPGLIEQLTHFQNACRDVARRVGLTPFAAEPEEPFDAQRHEWFEGKGKPPGDARIEQTLATGYTFQGRLLRPALVRLRNGNGNGGEKGPGHDT